MLKKISLGQKLALCACIVLLLAFVLLNTSTLRKTYTYSREQAKTIASFTSKYNAEKIERNFEKVATIAKDFAIQMETMVEEGNPSREMVMATMKNSLELHKDLFGIAITYEPNEFDGKDIEYINKKGNNSKGQFMPYINRGNKDSFVTELCIYDYYTEEQMEWYNIPKNTKKIFLTEPTAYLVQGKNTTMASVAVPIIRDEKFVGVVSIDTSLDYLQTEVEKVKPMGGFAEIVSTEGTYVANGLDSTKVMKDVSKEEEWNSLLKRTSVGEEFTEFGFSSITGEKVLRVFSTINIKGTDQYWTYVSVIPFSNIFAEYNFSYKRMLVIGLALFLFIIYINYSIISKDL
jgi:methyl-accepting chemotaxis protein